MIFERHFNYWKSIHGRCLQNTAYITFEVTCNNHAIRCLC